MRTALLTLGVATLAASWLGPPLAAHWTFSAHMIGHVGVVAVAAPLLALGVGGGRLDPVPRAPWLFAAIPASLLELAVVWAWHAPALHHAARHVAPWGVAEQATFLATSLLVWLSALGGTPSQRAARAVEGVAALLLTSMHMTLLGALLALAPRALYPSCGGAPGLSALADQHLGGAVMLVVGGASYLLGGVWLTGSLLRRTATEDA